jgi:hypothetical protein
LWLGWPGALVPGGLSGFGDPGLALECLGDGVEGAEPVAGAARRQAGRGADGAAAGLSGAAAHSRRDGLLGGGGVLRGAARGAVPGAARPAAVAVASAMFGVWHIRPTADALSENQLATGRTARVATVAAVVAGTSAAGALLSCLRERSGSLAAPVVLHLAANCAGPLASAVNARLEGRFEGRAPLHRSGLPSWFSTRWSDYFTVSPAARGGRDAAVATRARRRRESDARAGWPAAGAGRPARASRPVRPQDA